MRKVPDTTSFMMSPSTCDRAYSSQSYAAIRFMPSRGSYAVVPPPIRDLSTFNIGFLVSSHNFFMMCRTIAQTCDDLDPDRSESVTAKLMQRRTANIHT